MFEWFLGRTVITLLTASTGVEVIQPTITHSIRLLPPPGPGLVRVSLQVLVPGVVCSLRADGLCGVVVHSGAAPAQQQQQEEESHELEVAGTAEHDCT